MKTNPERILTVTGTLDDEARRYKKLAQEAALSALKKSADGKTINDLDARLIRDHEIRAESFKTAAKIVHES